MMRLLALLTLVTTSVTSIAQEAAAVPDRGDAQVAASRVFVFYSDPTYNLHDFLVWNAYSRAPVEPATNCLASLPPAQRAAFEHALHHYKALATPAGNRLLLALRFRLAGFGDFGIANASVIEAALATLAPARAAYEKCWWATHDARNRRWIAALLPLLDANEEALSERLGVLYGEEFGRPLPVDVVSYGSSSGADSVVNPDHLLVSSVNSSNVGYAALEVVFHEASHTVFGPGTNGRLWTDLEAAAKIDGAPLAQNFWHAMLFYTTGSAVKTRLAEHGIDYDQYLYNEGLFERSWPGFRMPLERLWQPYLEGRAPRVDTLRAIVAAHKLPDRGDSVVAASRTFEFYSDVVMNMHEFLLLSARSPQSVELATDCLAGLPLAQRAAFEHARDHYSRTFASGANELVLLSMRWRLAKLGEINLADAAQIAATVAELVSAIPAYRTCWWPEHDARNRRWVANVLPLLDANEGALRSRLALLYGQEIARSLPVDVVGDTSTGGGSTVLNPHHLLVSSARPSTVGHSALETVFREASYTLFGRRAPGPLWQALQQESAAAGTLLPDDFLLLLLQFTTGKAVQARLSEQGVRDYSPHVYDEGLIARSLPAHRDAIERVWQAYVDGDVPMTEAVKGIVAAVSGAPR